MLPKLATQAYFLNDLRCLCSFVNVFKNDSPTNSSIIEDLSFLDAVDILE